MNKFKKEYESKKITMEEVYSMIKSNDFIWTSYNALEPQTFMKNLHTIADRVENISLRHAGLWCDYEYISNPKMQDKFHVYSSFYDQFARAAHDYKISSYIPIHLHNGYKRFTEDKHINIFVGMGCPMDKNGYTHFSLDMINEIDAVHEADIVVMQINPNMPTVYGDNLLHIRDIDYIVEVDEPLITIPSSEPNELDMAIGKSIGELVPDGACIQLGIGTIPNAVGRYLENKNDLGVHTEMITSIIAHLAEKRVITGKKKQIDKYKIVGNFALGTQELYDFIHQNPEIAIVNGAYTNNPFIIAQNNNQISINTCLQIDLTGQIASESIGYRQFSGTGGANDFAVGASHSKGGKSIIAVKSTAKKGTISTIQPLLSHGAVVSIGRNDIDYIVTEYGVAKIRGQTIAQRVENIINIAHPDFRDMLRDSAKEYKIW